MLTMSVGAACFSPDAGPTTPVPACPHLQIKAPDVVAAGQQAHVSVFVIGADVAPSFHWKVTDGTIASGQGTPNVLVDTAGFSGRTIRATVELAGLSPECATTAATAGFLIGPPIATTSR